MDRNVLGKYLPRKVIYSFFLAIAVAIISILVIFSSFTQSLEVSDPEISVIGGRVELSMNIMNVSQHVVREGKVVIDSGTKIKTEKIPVLLPGEDLNFSVEEDIPESLLFKVQVLAPFSQPDSIEFKISPNTIDPVDAQVAMPTSMEKGKSYDIKSNICNKAESRLSKVEWTEEVSEEYFEETGLHRTIELEEGQCKNLYLTLTPIKAGDTKISFVLKAAGIEKDYSQDITIIETENEGGE